MYNSFEEDFMKAEGVIITVCLENYHQLRIAYPNIQFVNLDNIQSMGFFKPFELITIIVDIDNYQDFTIEEIKAVAAKFSISVMFTSYSYQSLNKYYQYGETVFKNETIIGEQILKEYRARIKRVDSDYIFNYETRTVIYADQLFQLRNMPFLVLSYLVRHKNVACTREDIIRAVGGTPKLQDSRTIDVQINYLRKITGDKRIKTIVNEGYVFDDKK